MRFLLIFFVSLLLSPHVSGRDKSLRPQKKVTQYKGYRLVWNDEFLCDGRPADHWSYEHGFVRNNEEQWYQEDNATVEGGCLVIEGRKETVVNNRYDPHISNWRHSRREARYTSASLNTRNSFNFMYGRVEVRARVPVSAGAWPAIWLLGNQRRWPENGEIDVMEYYIRDGRPSILANACWGSEKRDIGEWNTGITPFTHFTQRDPQWADKFHLWRMDWDEDFIRIYLDGELMNEIDLSRTCNKGWDQDGFNPFSNQTEDFGHYILLNLAMGSSGGAIDETSLPMSYYIDFVRVYQKE